MIKILVVDDHAFLRDAIRSILEDESDMKVVGEASSGDGVLGKVEECGPDCILMDINLPGKNGIEATELVKKKYPNCRVLVFTMYEHDEYLMDALQAGADGYLLKDSSSEQVVAAIRMLYGGDSVIHPRMTKKLITYHQQKMKVESNENELTEREKEILFELVKGLSNKEIAEVLYISDKTVKIHINKIFKKLNVKSRSQAVIYAVRNQLVPLD
ncbi:MAG TPA: DNA-binding response regulator [Bacillus sp. (in: Bacteria)]|uniref:DNA-binding response regulator n=1 Tax=Bacillus cereus TaxID=1396 RepID=A0A9X7G5F0_BACCE|nr:response regulator transcription factor [Bacillus cereus]HCF55308.1 DNA-binding response regulator [Bacillus sp. (in: firmicutes)]PED43271.1 DNA-binding response regulator [Bacillus cereus]PEF15252.1 DNA-binding response regulator [Bacillus cereus]PET05735.1 DNA-binding response regulator [Bacillus cereus]PEV80909.1 DNA-binding response regulator [Bacillus cereus]